MLSVFQILLIIMMVICFMGTIGAKEKDMRQQCAGIAIASIVAMVVTFIV